MEDINNCHARLLSERELRNEMEVTNIMQSTTESIENMSRLIQDASDKIVEDCYLQKAAALSSKMQGNLQAREVLHMLQAYPPREYPIEEDVDPKKKAPKKEEKKKKRKKKEPAFPTPDWATELSAVEQKVA
jgi:hypothetical protein